jgi:hypothetical protein
MQHQLFAIKTVQQRIITGSLAHVHRGETNLGSRFARVHASSQGTSEKLCAETDPQRRHARVHGTGAEVHFMTASAKSLIARDRHGPSHDDEAIEALEVRGELFVKEDATNVHVHPHAAQGGSDFVRSLGFNVLNHQTRGHDIPPS